MAYKCGQEVFCDPKPLSIVSAIVHSPASFLDLKGEKLRILRIGIKAGSKSWLCCLCKMQNIANSQFRHDEIKPLIAVER